MITHGEIDKLRSIRAPGETVLSLYVDVPLDPAGLREVRARAGDLIKAAADGMPDRPAEDEQSARDLVTASARQSLGHTLAVFACADLGLLELVTLPAHTAERAVWAVRPHVRPLLAALQRHPDHRIVIITRTEVWLLAVADDRITTVARAGDDELPSAGLGGWHGLESYHAERRLTELDRHHYHEAAAILTDTWRHRGSQPLVIGGHAGSIAHLLAQLPREVRDDYAGFFAAEPDGLTPVRARQLAVPVIARWAEQREHETVDEVTGTMADVPAAIGLSASLAAVNAEAVDLLLIPDAGMMPGYLCERCGVLSVTGEECCDWGAASRPVPDLLEEMALRTLAGGGDVISARELRIDTTSARLCPQALG